jgi:hypothetical protein
MEQALKGFELGYAELNEYTHSLFGCVAKVGGGWRGLCMHAVALRLCLLLGGALEEAAAAVQAGAQAAAPPCRAGQGPPAATLLARRSCTPAAPQLHSCRSTRCSRGQPIAPAPRPAAPQVLGHNFAPFLQYCVPLALSSCNQDDGMFDSGDDDVRGRGRGRGRGWGRGRGQGWGCGRGCAQQQLLAPGAWHERIPTTPRSPPTSPPPPVQDDNSGSVALGEISGDDSADGDDDGRHLSVRTGLLDEKCAATQVGGGWGWSSAAGPLWLSLCTRRRMHPHAGKPCTRDSRAAILTALHVHHARAGRCDDPLLLVDMDTDFS